MKKEKERKVRKEDGMYCLECGSKEIYFVYPTWTKRGYTECKKCGYRLSLSETAHQRHYLRNIKPIEDENRRIDFANSWYDFIIWMQNNHQEIIKEFKNKK